MNGAATTDAPSASSTPGTHGSGLHAALRQMLAVLDAERQALASMDLEAIMGCADSKSALCDALDGLAAEMDPATLDAECREMLEAARRLNEVNRQIRNLVAANVAARLEALTGQMPLYRPQGRLGAAYGYAGARA